MRSRYVALGLLASGLVVSLFIFQSEAQRRLGRGRRALQQAQPLPALPTKPLEAVPMNLSARAVRILVGTQDSEPTVWKGSVALSEGRILNALPWRQGAEDQVDAQGNFVLRTRRVAAGTRGQQAVAENGLVLLVDAPATAQITVTTDKGTFSFRLNEVLREKPLRFLEGQAQVDAVAAPVEVAATGEEEDFPAASVAPNGSVYAVYIEHTHVGPPLSPPVQGLLKDFSAYRPKGGGDRLMFTSFNGKEWSRPEPLTNEGLDLWRPAVAVEGTGVVWVVWSQNVNGNWDLFARSYDPKARRWSPALRLTTDAGADINAVATRSASGRVWIAWQGWREGNFDIWALPLGEKGVQPLQVGSRTANEWSPSIAADARGNLFVAFDTYERGNYDVRLWTFEEKAPQKGRVVPVAESPLFEANPSVVCDGENRVWIAWEQRTPNWGKDMGAVYRLQGKEDPGTPLYRNATVKVACWADGRLQYPQADPIPSLRPALQNMNSYPRLGVDGRGRVWLAFRHRESWRGPAGTFWQSYLMAYEGNRWSPPILVAFSDNLLDNRPFLLGLPQGHLLVAYSSDGRYHRVGTLGVVNNSFWVATVNLEGPAAAPALAATPSEAPPAEAPVVHPDEEKVVARLQTFRLKLAGRTYQLLRGEFHRHTEISGDGGGDGSLEDMWRYALDAANLEWIGNGDHDNGGGREYSWWLVQKTTDIFHHPPRFVPMFSYERSVPYPNGHRNVMFAQRGIRTLPRGELPGTPEEGSVDTKNLYGYLKQFDGICASHTSATDMGTDWRDNDPQAEPVVEIYQGCRQNYEHLGAPRSATNEKESIGGWQPAGFVWEAFQKGFRMGFQASSDHISTHISYAIALAEEPTRRGILEAFKKRHCYAATDNILLVVTCGENLMGDEFTLKVPPILTIQAVGTTPIVQVDIVRQVGRDVPRYVYAFQPKQREVKTQWTDKEARPGSVHMYYVRVIQEDGNLAWASPLWVHYQP